MNSEIRYIVSVVDNGESCDGKARVLGAFKTEEEAKTYVRNDMEDVCDQLSGTCEQIDFDSMTIVKDDDTYSCWNVEAVSIPM